MSISKLPNTTSGRIWWPFYILLGWMLLVDIPNMQLLLPFYSTFYLRELATLLVIIFTIIRGIRKSKTIIIYYFIVISTFVTVFRTPSLNLVIGIKLFVRLMILSSSIIIIPSFIYNENHVKAVFLFTIILNTVLALTAPLQHFTGIIPELYAFDEWALWAGRSGFPRYVSILGDPNIGGMIGGLLPLCLLLYPRKKFLIKLAIWVCALTLIGFAQSMTGIILFVASLLIIGLYKEYSPIYIVILGFIVSITAILLPNLSKQVIATIDAYFSEDIDVSFEAPGVLPHTNRFLIDLDFRLFAYLDMNDTAAKIIFGSTYDAATPGKNYTSGIYAHNSYKEMYIAGGLVQLIAYFLLFVMTARRAYWLVKCRKLLPNSLYGTVISASFMFYILLVVMFFFPVYHYSGVGQVFWVSLTLLNVIYERWFLETLKPNHHISISASSSLTRQ